MTAANDTGATSGPTSGNAVALSAPDAEILGLFADARAKAAPPPRTFRTLLLDYSAHAAMIVGLIGFAWTISTHVSNHTAPAKPPVAAVAPAKTDELADLRRANQQMADDIRHLRASVETLRTAAAEDKASTQVRIVQAGLETVRHDVNSGVSQLNGKNEKLEKDVATKVQALNDRIGRLEHQGTDLGPTGSIAPAQAVKAAAVPMPVAKPADTKLASLDDPSRTADTHKLTDDAAKGQVIPGYVVRDVYEGVALVEGRHGSLEVVPGVSIPGAGVVKSIDRQGKGWTVTTTKGLLAYAAPPKDYRRMPLPRGYYPDYRSEF